MAATIFGTDCKLYLSDGTSANVCTSGWPQISMNYTYNYCDDATTVTRKPPTCSLWFDYPETTVTGSSYKTYGGYPKFHVYKTSNTSDAITYQAFCDENYATTTPVVWGNTSCYKFYPYHIKSPQELLKEIIQSRQAPAIRRDRQFMPVPADIREIRARETLRRVIGDEKYRGFLSKGFVSVRNPKSGKIYQIFPGHGITRVYENGQMIERLCVVLNGSFPPTDSVIVRYLMAINNEADLWKLAIKHGPLKKARSESLLENNRSLIEIYKELKVAA